MATKILDQSCNLDFFYTETSHTFFNNPNANTYNKIYENFKNLQNLILAEKQLILATIKEFSHETPREAHVGIKLRKNLKNLLQHFDQMSKLFTKATALKQKLSISNQAFYAWVGHNPSASEEQSVSQQNSLFDKTTKLLAIINEQMNLTKGEIDKWTQEKSLEIVYGMIDVQFHQVLEQVEMQPNLSAVDAELCVKDFRGLCSQLRELYVRLEVQTYKGHALSPERVRLKDEINSLLQKIEDKIEAIQQQQKNSHCEEAPQAESLVSTEASKVV